ncbi:hypothetical protein A2332_01125 [Candidatus Uhrbacteria bacterium RIFOXYB2_FULL_41_18]|nr:MAG: hypothetical protein UT94_C0047G0005 [Candidatus Uhrbacteria bacterium GW2011_GWF2_40_263]OGL97305.1 MAG: hypothetical protein A2332_01125 [Candidatus Uhrbacteria bacterium RIFOXYB2_FULL_41_18]
MEGFFKKKHHPFVTCAILFFVGIVFLIATGMWIVAATGIVSIPFFSRIAYTKPEPLREVSAGVPVETYIQTSVTTELASRLQQGRGQLLDPSIEVTLPENALTASLQSFSEAYGDYVIDVAHSQVVVDEDIGFEIFLPMRSSTQETAVKIQLMMIPEEGTILLDVKDVWIGSLHVPDMLVSFLASAFLERNMQQISSEFRQYVNLQSVEYNNGSLTLIGELSVEII